MGDSRYWSKDFVRHFIEIYKSYPCLWKVRSKDYTNKNLKNKAYEKLVEICKTIYPDANKDYVIKKIQSFRGSFRKEVKKVAESMRSGTGVDDIYVPTLWYYDLLLFTSDQDIPTASISNMDADELEAGCDNGAENNESQILEEHNNERESEEDISVQQNKNETGVKNSILKQASYNKLSFSFLYHVKLPRNFSFQIKILFVHLAITFSVYCYIFLRICS